MAASTSTAGMPAPDGSANRTTVAGRGGRWWALGALVLCVLAVGLDGTVLTVALPTLAGDLHASESDLQWFTSGYLLVLGAAMLPAGQLADRFGRKTILLGALALFGIGSAACAFATSPGWFIAARVLLGLGGAGVIVSALAVLTVLFDEGERPKAVGLFSAANFLSLPLGPLLGGWLLTHAWWGWVFLINVPIAAVGLVAGSVLIPQSWGALRRRIDVAGIVVSSTGLVLVTLGLIEAGQRGWTDVLALVCMAAGIAVIAGFVLLERRTARVGGTPMIEPGLFADRSYTWGVVLAAVAVWAMIGVLFTLPQYFQGVLSASAAGSGLRLIPLVIGIAAGAIPADRIADALGRKIAVTAGFLVLAVGLAAVAATSAHSPAWWVAGWTAVAGAGIGLSVATSTSAALSTLSDANGGIGSAVLQAVNKTAAPFGAALLGSVLSAGYLASLDGSPVVSGLPPETADAVRSGLFGAVEAAARTGSSGLLAVARDAFTTGMSAAVLVSAGVAVAGAVLAAVFMPSRTEPRSAMGRDSGRHDAGDTGAGDSGEGSAAGDPFVGHTSPGDNVAGRPGGGDTGGRGASRTP